MQKSLTPAIAETTLSRELSRPEPSRRIGPRDVFEAALSRWVKGEPIELGSIAAALGIGRATVFRWVGSRDQLLGEVLWHACLTTWRLALGQARGTGAERAADATYRMMQGVLSFEPFRGFLQRDPEYALRLLTGRDSLVQLRMVAEIARELQADVDRGELVVPLPLNDLAFMLVRMVESCIYSDQIAERPPNLELVRDTIRILLSAPPSAPPA